MYFIKLFVLNFFFQNSEDTLKLFRRPLPKDCIELIAKKTVFLYKLHDHLLHEQMLLNFYTQCKDFSTSLSSTKDVVRNATSFGKKSLHGMDRIDDSNGWDEMLG